MSEIRTRRAGRRGAAPSRVAAALAIAAALCGGGAPAARADEGPRARIVVWPRGPGDEIAGVDAAVRGAGFAPVAFEPLRERLRAAGDRALAGEAAALDAVAAALVAARERYLAQDGAAMAAALAAAEATALPALAQPRHAGVLWELELQRGLAELLRRDPEAARARFAFALELDATRAPRRDLYGPAVARAFAEAADARGQIPPRPTALAIEPRDARLTIDGLPVIDLAAPRQLRPGLHVVAAAAPGHRDHAAILELRPGEPIRIALPPAPGDAAERLGAAWAAGAIDPATASGRRAIAAAAAELGADVALVIDEDRARGDAGARAITAQEVGPLERRPTAAAAAAAALAHLSPEGRIVVRVEPARPPTGAHSSAPRARRSVLRAWWFWTAVGGIAATAVIGAGLAIDAQREQTLRILPPPP